MSSQTIVVLFNLKPGIDVERYEAWARTTDLPIVRGLPSIGGFAVHRATSLLGGGTPPYAYVELIEVRDMAEFQRDITTASMQRVAQEFQSFADQPLFILTESL